MYPTLKSISIRYMRYSFGVLALVLYGQGSSTAQCTLACSQGVQISLDQVGLATVSAGLIAPYAAQNCPDDLELTVFDSQNNPISNILDCSRIDELLPVRIRHLPTNNLCYGSITVKDYLPPVFLCPEQLIACTADTSVLEVGYPSIIDNCTVFLNEDLTWSDTYTDLPCFTSHNGTAVTARIDRVWSATDGEGNAASCLQKIFIKRNTLNDIQFPANRDGFAAPYLVCGQNANDLSLTGRPEVAGNPIDPNGACELTIGASDQPVTTCGNSQRILRQWTASDYCANTFMIHVQVIEIKDTTAPILVVPDTLVLGLNSGTCSATVTLPQAAANDVCNSVTTTVAWQFGNGFGPFLDVPRGNHIATYTATDACGNSTTKTLQISIQDVQNPSAICKPSVQISLPSNGSSELPANSIDNGSFDNCGAIFKEISRDMLQFSSKIAIDCQDVGQSFKAYLQVEDAAGLLNTCETWVTVNETILPFIACPNDITINCLYDPKDVNFTGSALASDNCTLDTLYFQDSLFLNSCLLGDIKRTWIAKDRIGNERNCTQIVTIESINTITVQFPPDFTLNSCLDTSALNPNQTGWPIITGQSCGAIAKDFTDKIIKNTPFGCYAIERTWNIRESCTYDPNTGIGLWSHIQRIYIQDIEPPQLVVPASITVSAIGCDAYVQVPLVEASDCALDFVVNQSTYADFDSIDASGLYPIGTHVVWFIAMDLCGNSSQASMEITVVDDTAPAVQCISNATIELTSNAIRILNPSHVLVSTSDNCSPASLLNIAMSEDTLDCSRLGLVNVTVSVSDAANNSSSCTVILDVTDPSNACTTSSGGFFELEGAITNSLGQPIPNIPVALIGDGYSDVMDCGVLGDFTFFDVPSNASYRLEPSNTIKPTLGLNTYDMLLITKHLLGTAPITDPLTLLAADANQSGSITPSDIVFLRKLLLGISPNFPNGKSWQFLPKSFIFTNPQNPFSDNPPSSINLLLDSHKDSLDYWGIKTGDIDNTANPANARTPKDTIFLEMDEMELTRFWPVDIELRIENWAVLEGFQFALKANPELGEIQGLEFVGSNSRFDAEHLNEQLLSKNEIRSSWTSLSPIASSDSLLLRFSFFPYQGGKLSELFELDESVLRPEAYARSGEVLRHVALRFKEKNELPRLKGQELRIFPNPFLESTEIQFYMPVETAVNVLVSDAQGRVVFESKTACSQGQNRIRINAGDLPGEGIYFFQIDSLETPPIQGKLILHGE